MYIINFCGWYKEKVKVHFSHMDIQLVKHDCFFENVPSSLNWLALLSTIYHLHMGIFWGSLFCALIYLLVFLPLPCHVGYCSLYNVSKSVLNVLKCQSLHLCFSSSTTFVFSRSFTFTNKL